jgi:hypothetical protein
MPARRGEWRSVSRARAVEEERWLCASVKIVFKRLECKISSITVLLNRISSRMKVWGEN